MKKVLTLVLTVLIICTFSACSSKESEDNTETLVTYQTSPDDRYTVCLYQVGIPAWPFGSVGAKLVLKDADGSILDEESFGIANDGGGVYGGNMGFVTWMDNGVEVVISHEEAPSEKYFLTYVKE